MNKSAPCKCCPQNLSNNCTECLAAWPATATLTDSQYGSCTLSISGNTYVGTIPSAPLPSWYVHSVSNCFTFTTGTTVSLKYTISCPGGSPDRLLLLIQGKMCQGGGICDSPSSVPSTDTAPGAAICTLTTVPSVNFPVDCSTPSFTFSFGALNCAVSFVDCDFYKNGANIVIS